MKTCSKCSIILTDLNWWDSWKNQKTNICISCGREANKQYDTKDKQKNRALKSSFNISLEDYKQMLHEQNYKCAICNTETSSGKGSFHVDHCHTTGKIRGLLCHYCNVGLGNFKDNSEILKKAIKYLKKEGLHYE